ncbi:MAG TPA: DUF1848 domain-containing protein, partial [Mesotoga infera]|nr:DUF1848 domain-containing protein [Mesotoga infera]HRV02356.1 DUF1848 domain-containing protein [Mesotoga sp.]
AFYGEWFFNRIREGFALVRNPMNPHQVSRVDISPASVDCIVFWSKDPEKMIDKLDELADYTYYFQFTLTPYNREIEPNLREKREILETFMRLSELIGRERVIWRYDPVIITERLTIDWHLKAFESMARKLSKFTEKCVISFVDIYRKILRNVRRIEAKEADGRELHRLARGLSEIAGANGLVIETCSELIDLSEHGIRHGRCVDDRLISRLLGRELIVSKDRNQREACGCVESVDIGAYNTCPNGCLYCYANFNKTSVEKSRRTYDPDSPMLCDMLKDFDRITERKKKDGNGKQTKLF